MRLTVCMLGGEERRVKCEMTTLVGELARELDLPVDCCLTFGTFPMEGDWSLGDCGVDSTTELEVETLTGPTTLARCAQLRAMGHEAHSKVIKADIFGKGRAARSEGTPLGNFLDACKNGELSTVQGMIAGGQDINEVCAISSLSAMSAAATCGQDEVLNWLIANGGSVNMTGEGHYPPIHGAAAKGWFASVSILVAAKADVDVKEDMLGTSALHVAVDRAGVNAANQVDMLHLLIHSKASINTTSKLGISPLHHACSKGATACVDLLLDYKCTFKSEDQKGVSPLGAAAAASCAEAVEMLLDVGAPVDASAIFGALNAESRECEALLLDAGACASATNSDGRTAMHIAAFTGNHSICAYLLDQKADADIRSKSGATPLMEAARGGRKGTTRVMINYGADVHLADNNGDTALHFAGYSTKSKVFEILCKAGGADAERENKAGEKPCIEGEKCVVM